MGDVVEYRLDDDARSRRFAPSLMPEVAIGMTVLLIAAPVVLVGGTLWMAAKNPLSSPQPEKV